MAYQHTLTSAVKAKPHALQGALLALLLVAGAFVAAIGVAFTNERYFQLANRFLEIPADARVLRGALFSSYLVLISLPLVVWRPGLFGLTPGETARHVRLVLALTLGFALFTALAVTLVGGTPFSGRSLPNLINEGLIVPVSEELFFRGVIFTALLAGMKKIYPAPRAVRLAIGAGGLSFGVAHLGNYFVVPLALTFVLPQTIFATLLGFGCCYLMMRTRSLFPAIWLHAIVNLVAVLL